MRTNQRLIESMMRACTSDLAMLESVRSLQDIIPIGRDAEFDDMRRKTFDFIVKRRRHAESDERVSGFIEALELIEFVGAKVVKA